MAQLFKTDGTVEDVRPSNGDSFSLREMQRFVGGLIDIIDLGEGEMVINDEGKLIGLPYNERATRLARPFLFPNDPGVFGDVLVCTAYEAGYRGLEAA